MTYNFIDSILITISLKIEVLSRTTTITSSAQQVADALQYIVEFEDLYGNFIVVFDFLYKITKQK